MCSFPLSSEAQIVQRRASAVDQSRETMLNLASVCVAFCKSKCKSDTNSQRTDWEGAMDTRPLPWSLPWHPLDALCCAVLYTSYTYTSHYYIPHTPFCTAMPTPHLHGPLGTYTTKVCRRYRALPSPAVDQGPSRSDPGRFLALRPLTPCPDRHPETVHATEGSTLAFSVPESGPISPGQGPRGHRGHRETSWPPSELPARQLPLNT